MFPWSLTLSADDVGLYREGDLVRLEHAITHTYPSVTSAIIDAPRTPYLGVRCADNIAEEVRLRAGIRSDAELEPGDGFTRPFDPNATPSTPVYPFRRRLLDSWRNVVLAAPPWSQDDVADHLVAPLERAVVTAFGDVALAIALIPHLRALTDHVVLPDGAALSAFAVESGFTGAPSSALADSEVPTVAQVLTMIADGELDPLHEFGDGVTRVQRFSCRVGRVRCLLDPPDPRQEQDP